MKKKLIVASIPSLGVLMTIGGMVVYDLYPKLDDTGVMITLIGCLLSIYGGMAAIATLREDGK